MKGNHVAAGVGEKMQYLVRQHNDNTIRFIVDYPGVVDADRLERAACTLANSVDVLHASFIAGSVGTHWQVHDDVTAADCFACVRADDVERAAQECVLRPVEPEGRAQLHCTLVQGADRAAVVLCLSHLCVDGTDGKYLLYKLAEAYNEPGTLRVKNGNRSATQIYEGRSREEMRSLMRSPLGGVKTIYPYDTEEDGEKRMTLHTIPAEVMAGARRRAKAMGATANDLLLAAGYHALACTPGIDRTASMSILSMMDLRKHCPGGDSPGLSNMVGSLCTFMREGVGENFAATLAEIARQTREAKEEPLAGMEGMPLIHGAVKTMSMGLLKKLVGRIYGSFSVGLTNLGMIDLEKLRLGETVPTGGCFGGPLKKKRAMQISAASFGGACSLCVVGQYTAEDATKLKATLLVMEAELARFAANL